jgi:hypothetical protein
MLVYIVLSAAAAIIWFWMLRRRNLSQAPEQHHLASMMIAALTAGSGVSTEDVSAWLAEQRWSGSKRSVRVSHALGLARANMPEDHHASLLDLARRLIGTH